MLSNTEPVTLVGALKLAVVGIATTAAIALKMEPDLTAAFVGAAAALAVVVGIIIERAMVVSPATRDKEVDAALHSPVPDDNG